MIIEPKVKGFICITAHPDGCAKNVRDNIDYVERQGKIELPQIKNVLVIGSSTGYGLASAITASFSLGANVLGVAFEKNANRGRTATAGLYNLAAYQKEVREKGLYLKNIIGDAFSDEIKFKVCEVIKNDMQKIDMIVYSIAAPSRIDPNTSEKYTSVIKPIGKEYRAKGIDLNGYKMTEMAVQPATAEEVENTKKVMGGEDLELWVDTLKKRDLLSDGAIVLAYSYVGPSVTHDIYLNGSIGMAKNHIKETCDKLSADKNYNVNSFVAVNKAVVTQASSAIPVLPLYISILFKVMKEKNIHEGCIEQMYRLFEKFTGENLTDERGFIRIDDWEMRDDVQREVAEGWEKIDDENINILSDLEGYKAEFLKLFGFGVDGVDYAKDFEDAEIEVNCPDIIF